MKVVEAIKAYYSKENYVYFILKTKQSRTSGLYIINDNTAEYSNCTVDIFKTLQDFINSDSIKIGLSIYKPGITEFVEYYNPELFNDDLMELTLFQKYGITPKKEDRQKILQESIKKEKIKESLVYACYVNDKEKIIEKAKTAKQSELEKKLQYTGTPLGLCAEHDFLEGFKAIASKGASVTKKSLAQNPIELAFRYSDNILFYIFNEFKNDFIELVISKGFSLAIHNRNEKVLQLLLSLGADLIGKDPYFPNLHNFADFENEIGMKFLLDNGFNINYKNKNKETAIERATRTNKIKSVEFLNKYNK